MTAREGQDWHDPARGTQAKPRLRRCPAARRCTRWRTPLSPAGRRAHPDHAVAHHAIGGAAGGTAGNRLHRSGPADHDLARTGVHGGDAPQAAPPRRVPARVFAPGGTSTVSRPAAPWLRPALAVASARDDCGDCASCVLGPVRQLVIQTSVNTGTGTSTPCAWWHHTPQALTMANLPRPTSRRQLPLGQGPRRPMPGRTTPNPSPTITPSGSPAASPSQSPGPTPTPSKTNNGHHNPHPGKTKSPPRADVTRRFVTKAPSRWVPLEGGVLT